MTHSLEPLRIIGAQGTSIWSGDTIIAGMTEARTNHKRARAYAELFADAPAAALVLSLLCAGKASIEPRSESEDRILRVWFGGLGEDHIGGKFYPITGTYTELLNAIGWDRARAALNAENGNG